MADSITGIPVYLLADLAVASAGANVIGADTDGDTDSVVVRDRWNQYAAVAISDHPADQGDGNERAVFVSKSLNNVWRLASAKLGTVTGSGDGTDGDFVVPE